MTKAQAHPLFSRLSGSLDDDHYIRTTKSGKMIISRKPDFHNRQFSEAQLSVQNRTKHAAAYAKVASKENPIYAKLAEGTDLNAYNVAYRDFQKPPSIDLIEWDEKGVRTLVHDDVLVTKVTISILDEAGQVLKKGDAELQMGVWWTFATETKGRILVEAWDLPGNVTRQEFSPQDRFFSVWKKHRVR